VVASQIGGRPVQALAVEFAHAAPGLSDKRQVQQVHDRLGVWAAEGKSLMSRELPAR
jgi:hypothetical protein